MCFSVAIIEPSEQANAAILTADSGDAQRAYSLLQMHASKSTMASIDGSVLIGYITTAKLGTVYV